MMKNNILANYSMLLGHPWLEMPVEDSDVDET
jgi:hypothetical protein